MKEFRITAANLESAPPTCFTENLKLLLETEARYRRKMAMLCDDLRIACEWFSRIEKLGSTPDAQQEQALAILEKLAQLEETFVGQTRGVLNDIQKQLTRDGCKKIKTRPAEGYGEQVYIEYREDAEIIRVELSGILPFKLTHGTHYQYGKVAHFMSEFLYDMRRNKGLRITIPYALVIFIHHYVGGRPIDLRDYDNLEKSCVLNALQTTGLFADSPAHMVLVELAAADTRNFTEVLITPVSRLTEIMASLDLGMYGTEGITRDVSAPWNDANNGEEPP